MTPVPFRTALGFSCCMLLLGYGAGLLVGATDRARLQANMTEAAGIVDSLCKTTDDALRNSRECRRLVDENSIIIKRIQDIQRSSGTQLNADHGQIKVYEGIHFTDKEPQ